MPWVLLVVELLIFSLSCDILTWYVKKIFFVIFNRKLHEFILNVFRSIDKRRDSKNLLHYRTLNTLLKNNLIHPLKRQLCTHTHFPRVFNNMTRVRDISPHSYGMPNGTRIRFCVILIRGSGVNFWFFSKITCFKEKQMRLRNIWRIKAVYYCNNGKSIFFYFTRNFEKYWHENKRQKTVKVLYVKNGKSWKNWDYKKTHFSLKYVKNSFISAKWNDRKMILVPF